MSILVALVHDVPEFADAAATALRSSGCDVVLYTDSMTALNGIEAAQTAQTINVLVTRVSFPEGKPNGVSLALVLRNKYPDLKVVFVAQAEQETYTEGIGELVPHPVNLQHLIEAVERSVAVV